MDEATARKISKLLWQSTDSLSPKVLARLAVARRTALIKQKSEGSAKLGYAQVLVQPQFLGVSTALLACLAALVWFVLTPTFPLDASVHPEQVPNRAFVDKNFAPWAATEPEPGNEAGSESASEQ